MAAKLTKHEEFTGTGPVRYRLEGPADGPTGATISIDYTEAPVPEHFYVADYFRVINLEPQVLFVFGKWEDPEKCQKLRNKLEIYFPAVFFVKQLWKSSREFHQTLRSFVEQYGYAAGAPGALTEGADKVQTIHSNNVLMVLSSGEAMMDFFYLSPREMYFKPRKKRNIELEPLVRVIIAPTLLLGFLDGCQPIAESLRAKFPAEEGNKDEDLESN